MLSRRELIGKAAVGAAGALALGAARTGVAATRVRPAAPADRPTAGNGDGPAEERAAQDATSPAEPQVVAAPPPWELVSPLAAGAMVAHGWRLADLSPVRDGSCVVTLKNASDREHRVHVCRNDGTPQGLVYTRRLDLVVMNGGQGDLPTEEGFAQAVASLAHVVAANEATTADHVFADLLPHQERVQRFSVTDGTPAMEGKLR
jgi:hypothetical protein